MSLFTMQKLSRVIRYLLRWPLLVILAFITMPLTLFCKWNGFWLLYIMNEENCSYKRAKVFLKEDPKYQDASKRKYHDWGNSEIGIRNRSEDIYPTSSLSELDHRTHPSYSSFSDNIYHNF